MPEQVAECGHFLDSVSSYGSGVSTSSSIPLYYQLYMILKRGVRDRALEPGTRFPSEEAIASHFRVSRPTANRAIQEMIDRGWLVRRRGRGTFVQQAAPTQLSLLSNSLSFSDDIAKRGKHVTRFVRKAAVVASEDDAIALELEPGAPVQYIRRLHMVDERIVMVCDSKLSADRFPGLLETEFVRNSLYKTLEAKYDCPVHRAERCVEAAEILEEDVAELLGVPMFAPVLLMTGLAFDVELHTVEAMTAYVREGVMFKNLIVADPPPIDPQRRVCPRTHAPRGEGGAC
jgi:DNA-binding GntR family transcriptional regulator